MVLKFDTNPVVALDGPDLRRRRIVEISSGYFASRHEELRGRVLRGGSDWRVRLDEGRMMLNGRLALSTDSGDAIAIRFVGRRSGEADLLTALDRGVDIGPQQVKPLRPPLRRDRTTRSRTGVQAVVARINERRQPHLCTCS